MYVFVCSLQAKAQGKHRKSSRQPSSCSQNTESSTTSDQLHESSDNEGKAGDGDVCGDRHVCVGMSVCEGVGLCMGVGGWGCVWGNIVGQATKESQEKLQMHRYDILIRYRSRYGKKYLNWVSEKLTTP